MTELAPSTIRDLAHALHAEQHKAPKRRDTLSLPPGVLAPGLTTLLSQESFLEGWTVLAGGGAAFTATIIDGDDATGMIVAGINLAAGAAGAFAFPGVGLRCRMGVTINVTSGTAVGSVLVRPSH